MNPTNAAYSFRWTCDQQERSHEQPLFVCFTEQGQLRPEKKVEVNGQGAKGSCQLGNPPVHTRTLLVFVPAAACIMDWALTRVCTGCMEVPKWL